MKITIRIAGLLVIILFAGGIALSSALGFWKTESSKEVVKIKTGEFAGMPNPADIRGSYSWNDIAKNFNIDVNVLLQAFGGTNPETQVKTLEDLAKDFSLPSGVELGTNSVRVFVSLYTGIPYESTESEVWMPKSAVEILLREGKGDKAIIEKIQIATPAAESTTSLSQSVNSSAPAPTSSPATNTTPVSPSPVAKTTESAAAPVASKTTTSSTTTSSTAATSETHEEKPAYTVTGKTTFGELKLWGVSKDTLKEVLGADPGPDPLALKDWASQNEKSFSELKEKIQALVDEVKK